MTSFEQLKNAPSSEWAQLRETYTRSIQSIRDHITDTLNTEEYLQQYGSVWQLAKLAEAEDLIKVYADLISAWQPATM
jgi:hypothetical protein